MDTLYRALVIVVSLVCVLVIVRRFVWWYWGIDRHVAVMERIASALERLRQ